MKMRWMVAALLVCAVGGGIWAQEMPEGDLLLVCKDDNALEIVNAGTMAIAKVGVGVMPHEVALSADGRTAVVTNYGPKMDGNSISVVDVGTRKEIHRVDLGGLRGPHGVVFFDGKAWFTVEGSKKIARYDPVTNRIDWTHEIGQERTHMLVMGRDGHTIYTSNVGSGTVTAVVANADRSVWTNTNIAVGKNPEAIDLSPDGMELWVGNGGDGTVSVIDTETKKVVGTIDLGAKRINRLKFTPDGKTVLVSDMGSGNLIGVDVKSRKEVKRVKLGNSAEGILILPDGKKAFVAVSGENKVVLVDFGSWTVAAGSVPGNNPDGMAWLGRE